MSIQYKKQNRCTDPVRIDIPGKVTIKNYKNLYERGSPFGDPLIAGCDESELDALVPNFLVPPVFTHAAPELGIACGGTSLFHHTSEVGLADIATNPDITTHEGSVQPHESESCSNEYGADECFYQWNLHHIS